MTRNNLPANPNLAAGIVPASFAAHTPSNIRTAPPTATQTAHHAA